MTEIEGQLLIMPDADMRDIRVKGLLEKYPVPTTAQMAVEFLSAFKKAPKDCTFTIRSTSEWDIDVDFLLVVLKTTDTDANPVYWETTVSLSKIDKNEHDRVLIECAQETHRTWLWYESSKHKAPKKKVKP